jgi:hypothetical protein
MARSERDARGVGDIDEDAFGTRLWSQGTVSCGWSGLTNTFEVVKTREVKPWRVVNFPGCRYVLELPIDVEPPLTGETLEMRSA